MLLSVQSSGGPNSYTLADFKLAFCVQYLFWAIGLIGFFRCRRTLRAARGLELAPFHRAVAKRLRERR